MGLQPNEAHGHSILHTRMPRSGFYVKWLVIATQAIVRLTW
jgi:hypothetical protein